MSFENPRSRNNLITLRAVGIYKQWNYRGECGEISIKFNENRCYAHTPHNNNAWMQQERNATVLFYYLLCRASVPTVSSAHACARSYVYTLYVREEEEEWEKGRRIKGRILPNIVRLSVLCSWRARVRSHAPHLRHIVARPKEHRIYRFFFSISTRISTP